MNKIMIVFILLPLMVFQFQNCGRGGEILKDHEIESRTEYFAYPYKQKPEFYHEIFLSKEVGSNSTTDKYKVLASVASASGVLSDLDYKLEILDQEGRILCPVSNGVLVAGSTVIEYECFGIQNQTEVDVVLTLSQNNKDYEIKKTLNP